MARAMDKIYSGELTEGAHVKLTFSYGFAYREDACKDAEGADHLERYDATVWCFYAFWFACNCVCTSWE